jgi:hypothetical protein
MLASQTSRRPAPFLACRGVRLRRHVRPNAFGNALGNSIAQGIASSGSQQADRIPSNAGYRNEMDRQSDAYRPAMNYNYRNGYDVQSDAYNPATEYGYRNGMDIASDNFNPASAYGYRNGADVQSDNFNPASAYGYRNGSDVQSDSFVRALNQQAKVKSASVTGAARGVPAGTGGTTGPYDDMQRFMANSSARGLKGASGVDLIPRTGGYYAAPASTMTAEELRGQQIQQINRAFERAQANGDVAEMRRLSTSYQSITGGDPSSAGNVTRMGRVTVRAMSDAGQPLDREFLDPLATAAMAEGINGMPAGGGAAAGSISMRVLERPRKNITLNGNQALSEPGASRSTAPTVGGGAKLENLSPLEIARIQNAANRTGVEISVVGSRANGTSHAMSDWDYVVPVGTKSSTTHSLKNSLPEGPRGLGDPRNQDFFKATVDASKPFITFKPQGSP